MDHSTLAPEMGGQKEVTGLYHSSEEGAVISGRIATQQAPHEGGDGAEFILGLVLLAWQLCQRPVAPHVSGGKKGVSCQSSVALS